MSVVADAASTTPPTSLLVEHRPWWRSRVTLTAGIVGVMLVCYFALSSRYPWPAQLTWNTLPTHLNDFQTWLVDQRNAESPSVVIRAFNGFAGFLDDLVQLVHELPRVDDLGGRVGRGRSRVVALRGRARLRLGARRLRRVRGERPLGREHADARADAGGGRALAPRRHPARGARGALRPVRALRHAGARRDADHPGVRVPDARRDPLLRRPGRCGDHDDDLRDPARDSHHGARDSRRPDEHRRGRARDGLDAVAGAREGTAPAGATDAAPLRQPDDPLRAVDGRHRRADRRQGARRRRHERSQLVPGARTARRHRDRGDGDGARSGHGGGRGADEPGAPPSDRRPAASVAEGIRSHRRSRRRSGRRRAHPRRRRRLLAHDGPRLAACAHPVGARLRPEPRHAPLPGHELVRRPHRPVRARAVPELPRGDARGP